MSPFRMSAGAVCVAVSVLGSQQRPTFQSETRIARVFATVIGNDGRLVTGLGSKDFEVLFDGARQAISIFENQSGPLSIVALFQTGFAIGDHPGANGHETIQTFAAALIDALRPSDHVRIASSGSEIAFSPHKTQDKSILRRIARDELWGRIDVSPLWSATYASLLYLKQDSERRVLVVFANGINDAAASQFRISAEQIRDMAYAWDVMVYGIALGRRGIAKELREIADATGGGAFVTTDRKPLETMRAVIEELHHQYILGFSAPAHDDERRTLKVVVRVPGAKVRARDSYVGSVNGMKK